MIRTTATFSIWSKIVHPDEITRVLGAEADDKIMMGSARTPPQIKPDAYGWHIMCVRVGDEVSPEDVLDDLVQRVGCTVETLPTLRGLDADLDVRFTVRFGPNDYSNPLSPEQDIALVVSQPTLATIASAGATLDFAVFKGH